MSGKEYGAYKYVSLVNNDDEEFTLANLFSGFIFDDGDARKKLYSHNISKEQVNKYIHKWFLFLSLIIQLVLKKLALFVNKLRFKLDPSFDANKYSDNINHYSILGRFDMRLDLDKNIKHEDGRYYPMLAMMASKIAYENEAVIQNVVSQRWKMEFVKFYDFYNEFQQKKTTQAFIFQDRNQNKNNMIYVCFRGTSLLDADDWSSDFDISWCKIKGLGKLHMGFNLALGLKKYHPDKFIITSDDTNKLNTQLRDYFGHWPKHIEQDDKNHLLAYYTIRDKLKEMLVDNPKAKIIVTGHSLGGALAIVFPAILTLHKEWDLIDRMEGVYTFGQPRVGDEKFGQVMSRVFKEHCVKYYRFVYANDIVPTLPWDKLMLFKHFGMCIHFNSLYQAKVVKEEWAVRKKRVESPNLIKRILVVMKWVIITIMGLILARLNALWELIRGFLIGYVKGPDYKEGWLAIMVRIFGIISPGGANHFARDYVNATRLTSPNIFLNYPDSM